MALKIVWSRKADRKFDKIIQYLENEWGKNVAKTFIKRTYEFLDLLAEFPEIGSIEHSEKQIRGFVLIKQTTLFYKIKGATIVVLNFYDNRRNPKKKRYI